MSVLVVPALDSRPWPSLGPQVCEFVEQHMTFGPGDLLGQPAKLDDEKRGLIYRMYEVHPLCRRVRGKGVQRASGGGWCHSEEWRHPATGDRCPAGRRRFSRCALSLRKGSAKTELAAWVAICELHPDGPVRTVGWDRYGQPIGGGVTDPYIPMVAYTEEQSEDLAYGAMRVILLQEACDLSSDFDIGLARIMRLSGAGKAEALATAPKTRDGARTTFQHFDETHHMSLPRLKKAHRAMLANIPKRVMADAWSLETTTAPSPGEGSVAEDTMEYAQAIHEKRISEPKLFFFHRQASERHDLTTVKGIRAAVREASGPVARWSNLEGIVDQWKDPTADHTYLRRVWLNQLVRSADRAFDALRWKVLAKPRTVEDGALIVLGFDGSRYEDATAIVGTEVPTGYQFVVGAWEKPYGAQAWEVPAAEVEEAMAAAFGRWDVWRLYADPPYWETHVDRWRGEFGDERVIAWRTNQWKKTAEAVRAYGNAIKDGDLAHDGDETFARHVGNAFRRRLQMRDEDGRPLFIIQKERPDSPNKIDTAMAGVLSWQARRDAVAEGVGEASRSVYEEREPYILPQDEEGDTEEAPAP